MNVITSLGIPARRSRTNDPSHTPVVPEPRASRPSTDAGADQRSSSQTTTVASSNNQT